MNLKFIKAMNARGDIRQWEVFEYIPWRHEWQGMSEPERVRKGIFVHCGGHGDFEVFRLGIDVQIEPDTEHSLTA